MALRTIESASSRRVTITGGGLRPMRCMAASREEIVPWRCSSEPAQVLLLRLESPSRASMRLSWASLCWIRLARSRPAAR